MTTFNCLSHSQAKLRPLQKACLYPGCVDPCLCTTCEKSHPSEHQLFFEDIDDVFSESLFGEVSALLALSTGQDYSQGKTHNTQQFLADFIAKDLKNAFDNAYQQLVNRLMPNVSQLVDLQASLASQPTLSQNNDKSSYNFESLTRDNLKSFIKSYATISNQFDQIVYNIHSQLRSCITDLSKSIEEALNEQVKLLSAAHQERIDRYSAFKTMQKTCVPGPITRVKVKKFSHNTQDFQPIGELLSAYCTLYQKDRKFFVVSNSTLKVLKHFTIEEYHPEMDQLLISQHTLQLIGFKKDVNNEETFVYIYDLRSGRMTQFSSIPLRVNSAADSLNGGEVWLATENKGLYLLDLATFQISLFATGEARGLTDIMLIPPAEQLIGLTSDKRIQVYSISDRVPVLVKTVPLATLENYKELKIADACVYGNKNNFLYVSVYGRFDQFQYTSQVGHLFWIGDTDFYYPRVQKLEELSAPFNFKIFRSTDKTTVVKWIKRINTNFPYPAIIFKDSTDTFIHHVRINEPKKILQLQHPYCLLVQDNDRRIKFVC